MDQEMQPRKMIDRVPFGHIAAAAFVVGGLAACGSASPSGSPATNSPATSPPTSAAGGSTKSVVVSTAKNSTFGTILVSGKALYTLMVPSSTPCDSACLAIWPELVLPKGVTAATAGNGVSAANLGTVSRGGGVLQVTYAGKALYFFSGDTAAGQVNGNVTDTWGKWSDVVTVSPASHSTATTAPAGSGGAGF
jgi:predicted lipoprotein with Yx(FWY)xxD motif